jgi:uncharacterized membrane protein YgdD (TMEM256/DUF423 family)
MSAGTWVRTGALLLAAAVALGAFGAHGLRGRLDAYAMGVYEKAVFYHAVHALGILVVTALASAQLVSEDGMQRVCYLLAGGIVLFSGSLYLLAVTGIKGLGMITPLGGIAFIAAWLLLGFSALK